MNPPILHYPDLRQHFIIDIDASNEAIGEVLMQNFNDIDLPISYASRSLINLTPHKTTLGLLYTTKTHMLKVSVKALKDQMP